jgi:hypothetical protein
VITPAVTLAAEGIADFAILRRLLRDAKLIPGTEYGGKGKSHLDQRTPAYNLAAKHTPWVVARDMDHDAQCPGQLARNILPKPSKLMRYRIVVRSAEAWLLSDREKFAEFFAILPKSIPSDTESIEAPKVQMLNLLYESRSKEIREATVRVTHDGLKELGPEYNSKLSDFAENSWRPSIAAEIAPSLASARNRIRELSKILRGA